MVNPTRKKGAGIDFVLPGSRLPTAAAEEAPDARVAEPEGAALVPDGGIAAAVPEGTPSASSVAAPAPPVAPVPGFVPGLSPDRARGRTGVGLLAETVFESQRLERRIAELNSRVEQLTGERGAQAMDPRHIVPSRWANRHPDSFAGPEFDQLKREIEDAGGNVQPIKVRPIPAADGRAEEGARYEIVFGHRRHRACLELGMPVVAVVDELNDTGLFVQMERENRGRENLSAWEQGRMYLRAIEEGLFPSNIKLAAAIGRDASDIGKAVRAARLPQEITSAFPSPTSIQFRWVADLERALKDHEADVLARARSLGQVSPRPPAAEVFASLSAPLRHKGVGPSHPLRTIDLGSWGVATVRQDPKGRTLVDMPPGSLPQERWTALETALRKLVG